MLGLELGLVQGQMQALKQVHMLGLELGQAQAETKDKEQAPGQAKVVGVVQVQGLVLDMVRVLVEEAGQAVVKATARAMAMVKVLVAKMAIKNMPPMVP
jgi:hypothetical protein